MADKMEFPKTMKEFIDNYSFKDSDEVYTNGSMLIQTYRVEQAIEHYEQEIINKAIDEFVKNICEKYTEEESKGHYKQYCASIKQDITDIAEQMKGSEIDG